jgi:hypothetical protein
MIATIPAASCAIPILFDILPPAFADVELAEAVLAVPVPVVATVEAGVELVPVIVLVVVADTPTGMVLKVMLALEKTHHQTRDCRLRMYVQFLLCTYFSIHDSSICYGRVFWMLRMIR